MSLAGLEHDDDDVGVDRKALADGHRERGALLPAAGNLSKAPAQGKGYCQLAELTPLRINRLSMFCFGWLTVAQSSLSTPPVSPLFGFQHQ